MRTKKTTGRFFFKYSCAIILITYGCSGGQPWNSPYRKSESQSNVLYSAFSERPKHLDPARSYSSNEYELIAQIYEPPLQYHFLRRPYELIPLTATEVPKPVYLDAAQNLVGEHDPKLEFSFYEVKIRPGIKYQPHPAFAKNKGGKFLYHNLQLSDLDDVYEISDFSETGTREMTAADYVYQIKRLAHPAIHSPILSIMAEYIVGLRDYAKELDKAYVKLKSETTQTGQIFLDLRKYDLAGVELIDQYTYRIKIKGKYPQILYWLAMPFFAPMPVEADQFYSQPGMEEKNLNLHWYPVGTGPYMLSENNPNLRMVLNKNPNFHGESYPAEGEAEDAEVGMLKDAGKSIPFINRVVFSLEKESIPYWNKFLQGYFDSSSVNSESFDQVVQMGSQGDITLSDEMKAKGISLATTVQASTYYMGFNMIDKVIGGHSERARKLRQAIAIAVDYDELIAIFSNGRGIQAHGPLPPGIFGYLVGKEGVNPYVFDWVNGKPKRKSIAYAKKLLSEAGYANGIDQKANKPLILYFDTTGRGPETKARLDWFRKQFQKIDIQLVFRDTDYNRFQEKMFNGDAQIFQWGWNADYPDPENFMFLLYGPNGKVKHKGENASNYQNPEFDRLFEKMKNMSNSPKRLVIIGQMLEILRKDSPWLWGYHPKQFSLYHGWLHNNKPNVIANNTLKYKRIDPDVRNRLRNQWNQPAIWPIGLVLILLVLVTVPAAKNYWRREHGRTESNSDGNSTA